MEDSTSWLGLRQKIIVDDVKVLDRFVFSRILESLPVGIDILISVRLCQRKFCSDSLLHSGDVKHITLGNDGIQASVFRPRDSSF